MSYQIHEASPKAKAKIKDYSDLVGTVAKDHHRKLYPFDELKIGQCFIVPVSQSNANSLRVSACRTGKRTSKTFTVINHTDLALIEVARIA